MTRNPSNSSIVCLNGCIRQTINHLAASISTSTSPAVSMWIEWRISILSTLPPALPLVEVGRKSTSRLQATLLSAYGTVSYY